MYMEREVAKAACLIVLLTCASPFAQNAPSARQRPALQNGEIVTIHSVTKPEQSYELYVPSNYTPDRHWPIIYAFDPSAQGSRPLQFMKEAAETYGYLVAGSNNSRNGSWEVERDAAQEMWNDTHQWLSIDDRRSYFAGLSGGARVSAQLAEACNCARGVFLSGAGFPQSAPPSRKSVFLVFSTVGMTDFNYGELVELDEQLEALGFRHFLQRFDGKHEWAPSAAWQEAFAWASVLEMKDKLRKPDKAFISKELALANERLERREQAGELYFESQELGEVIAEFDGLADTALLKAHLASLDKNPMVRAAAKQEKADIQKQRALETGIVNAIYSLPNAGADHDSAIMDASTRIRRLREQLGKEHRPETQLALKRALGSIFVSAMEAGSPILEKGDGRRAASYFELAAIAIPELSWPYFSLASCHALTKDKKAAFRDLKEAHALGASSATIAEYVKSDPRLAGSVDGPEYKKLLATAP